jgi:hypothetical protein
MLTTEETVELNKLYSVEEEGWTFADWQDFKSLKEKDPTITYEEYEAIRTR